MRYSTICGSAVRFLNSWSFTRGVRWGAVRAKIYIKNVSVNRHSGSLAKEIAAAEINGETKSWFGNQIWLMRFLFLTPETRNLTPET